MNRFLSLFLKRTFLWLAANGLCYCLNNEMARLIRLPEWLYMIIEKDLFCKGKIAAVRPDALTVRPDAPPMKSFTNSNTSIFIGGASGRTAAVFVYTFSTLVKKCQRFLWRLYFSCWEQLWIIMRKKDAKYTLKW